MSAPDHRAAVLFDLFNTLVPGGSRVARDEVSRRMAAELGVDPQALAALVRTSFDARTRGRSGDLIRTVSGWASQLGGDPAPAAVERAVDLRLDMTRTLLERTWALPALAALRSRGIRIGLVSDCSAETPELWAASPLAPYVEATSFSCVTGSRKPEPAAYLAATDALGVTPAQCLFVGDGGSGELTGASALGMATVRFTPRGPDLGEPIDADTRWTGPTVTDLHDLLVAD